MDEISVSDYLGKLRMDQEGCIGRIFATISAYGAHGAMCHYSATPESSIPLEPRGLYLIDSGGQYYDCLLYTSPRLLRYWRKRAG